jgi:putative ABC transport system permease protein
MDPDRLTTMYPSVILPRAQRLAFSRDRLGAVIGADLAKEHGWKVGDRVPLKSALWVHKDGSNVWAFDIVGIYKFPPDAFPANSEFWINYNYLDDARAFGNGMITMFFVNIDDASNATRIANNIDGNFSTLRTRRRPRMRMHSFTLRSTKLVISASSSTP